VILLVDLRGSKGGDPTFESIYHVTYTLTSFYWF
jgi:hypothetical protein